MTCLLLTPFAVPCVAAPASVAPEDGGHKSSPIKFDRSVEIAEVDERGRWKKRKETLKGTFRTKSERTRNTLGRTRKCGSWDPVRSATSLAIARHRALELVTGGGIVDDDDLDAWNGVPRTHENDDRRDTIVWTSTGATVIVSACDGYASLTWTEERLWETATSLPTLSLTWEKRHFLLSTRRSSGPSLRDDVCMAKGSQRGSGSFSLPRRR